MTEFTDDGRVVFDARIGAGMNSYRAYRFPWRGRPADRPAIAVRETGDDRATVYASWNGATEVARWQVLAGADPERLRPVEEAAKSGFETAIPVQSAERFIAVRALDQAGKPLGSSQLHQLP